MRRVMITGSTQLLASTRLPSELAMSQRAPTSQPVLEPRFALLHHALEAAAGRFDHWDLMLEHGGSLVTFELERLPAALGLFETRRLADHRLLYLDYEGHISGNRGQVIRLDRGRYLELPEESASGVARPFRYHLHGQRLNATISADQPLYLLPFAQPVHLEALQWNWHD
jgi:hypothetical protein